MRNQPRSELKEHTDDPVLLVTRPGAPVKVLVVAFFGGCGGVAFLWMLKGFVERADLGGLIATGFHALVCLIMLLSVLRSKVVFTRRVIVRTGVFGSPKTFEYRAVTAIQKTPIGLKIHGPEITIPRSHANPDVIAALIRNLHPAPSDLETLKEQEPGEGPITLELGGGSPKSR